jgi:hypothetical protein
VKLRWIAYLTAALAVAVAGPAALAAGAKHAAKPAKPAISEEAAQAIQRMSESLRSEQYSFQVRTIRVYAAPEGQPLHIFHTMKVTVHRPNRLLADIAGDDGARKLIFDGKNAVVFSAADNKYASVPVPGGTIEAMMKELVGRLGVDFPLADFFTEAPGKAFLTGVVSGGVVNTVTIDGTPCLHLLFSQPPGIELELWLEKNDKSLPRRLIVTYTDMPGAPSFVAEFSDWDFSIHPPDSLFAFEPPAGATQVELKPPASPARAKGGKR